MTRILRHNVVGLPRSGKTTYLAALWHLVSAGDTQAGLQLRLAVSDTSYLDAIANQWRRCEPMERTRQAEAAYVMLPLHETSTNQNFDLQFPDMAGESFEEQLFARELDTDHADWLDHPGGTLLFLTADRGPDGLDLQQFTDLLSEEETVSSEAASLSRSAADSELDEWSARSMTEQAKLVELLQIAAHIDEKSMRRAIAIIVSAWDVLADQDSLTPADWLRREKPLLWQYLGANTSVHDIRLYGVSAQGGDVQQADSKDRLLHTINPGERILCVGADGKNHDITRPIQWLNEQGAK